MLKGKITSASISGQKDYHQKLAKKIRSWIKSHPDDFGKEVAEVEGEDGEGEDVSSEQEGEDSKAEASRDSSGGGGSTKTIEDHVSDIIDNPIMIGITSLCVLLILLEFYFLIFGRGGTHKPVEAIKDVKQFLTGGDPLARLEELERKWEGLVRHMGGLDKVVTETAVKAMDKAGPLLTKRVV